jgi:putative glutamine amidotransferase
MRVLASRTDARTFEVQRFGDAWRRADGAPDEIVWVTPSAAAPLAGLDPASVCGVLLTGGPDVEPRRYGEAPLPGVELHCDGARDDLDLDLLAQAAAYGWPVLAVCYGIQILAVSCGGTLIQDLPRLGLAGHAVREPKDFLAHEITVIPGARTLVLGRIAVNSRHHQAVASVGPGLRVIATAPDGVIEAVEGVDERRFVLGVQWHPENLRQHEHVAVFSAFRAAAERFAAARC